MTTAKTTTSKQEGILKALALLSGKSSFEAPMPALKPTTKKAGARKGQRMVVTSAINNTPVHGKFLDMLKNYCKARGAKLMVIPLRYKNPTTQLESKAQDHDWYDPKIAPFLFDQNFADMDHQFKVLGTIKVQATAHNPLSGLDSATRGMTTIIGHPQLQMKALPTNARGPIFLTTTGSITENDFSDTKAGYKASFHHSLSAIVIEPDSKIGAAHIRQLHYHDDGIVDLDKVYTARTVKKAPRLAALVLGDEHAVFASKEVKAATFGKGGLVEQMAPKMLVRHDVLDCHAVSHHHEKNAILKYRKHIEGKDNLLDELTSTAAHIENTTPAGCESVIVSSNHNEHLGRWINEADWKKDMRNAKAYLYLMAAVMESIDHGKDADPFELFCEGKLTRARFLGRNESLMVAGIELGNHGDHGFNGSRGSRVQYAQLPDKTVIGHSHSAGIEKGCYQTGTSSILRMEYNLGPSSWTNTHCAVHANGKRQLITMIEGRHTA
jgi:hypothetical protein